MIAMSTKPIRLMVVAAQEGKGALQDFINDLEGVEIVGIAYNSRTATQQLKRLEPDVLLVDVMLLGLRSIDIISLTSTTQPEVKILALSPGDPPHDRIILALQAGALGYICRDAEPGDVSAAIHSVFRGEYSLPLEPTYDVLRAAAPELEASAKERLSFLFQALLGLIPVAGLIAAITGFLWREYWGQIGVRVVDMGVDASTRVTEFVLTFFVILGILGPLHFVENWTKMMRSWVNENPRLKHIVARLTSVEIRGYSLSTIFSNERAQWIAMAALVLAITIPLDFSGGRILTILIGATVAVIMMAHFMSLDDYLPNFFRPSVHIEKALIIDAFLFLALLLVLSAEVFIRGPVLRPDGLHGFLAPKVLDLSAKPVRIFDLDEKQPPLEALYLGGNADLYVLYDPCKKTVRMIPVGSSRVEYIKRVECN